MKSASAVLLAFLLATPLWAAKKPGLEPYAGSYTGKAIATTSAGAITKMGTTLTFTGKKSGLRGTFLYNGILSPGGVEKAVNQVFNLTSKGVVSGRVNVGDLQGTGAGKCTLVKKTLTFSIDYLLTDVPATTIHLAGKVKFSGRSAVLTATVTSSDPAYDGTLRVTGKR